MVIQSGVALHVDGLREDIDVQYLKSIIRNLSEQFLFPARKLCKCEIAPASRNQGYSDRVDSDY